MTYCGFYHALLPEGKTHLESRDLSFGKNVAYHRYRDTLMTSQGSDTMISNFKCNISNTIKSLRLLKMT